MEREVEKAKESPREAVLEESVGVIRIADDVVAMIASIAATEVEGVAALAGNITNELLGKVGMKRLSRGVRVEIRNSSVRVEIAVAIRFGYSIPEVSQKLQGRVKAAIENMTGLTCSSVNIRFSGVAVK